MQDIKYWIELAYFISGVVIASVAIIGLKQINIMKRDMLVRIDRAAKEKAIEYATRYLSVYVSKQSIFTDEYRDKKCDYYKGLVTDFTVKNIPKYYFDNMKQRYGLSSWLSAMNEL